MRPDWSVPHFQHTWPRYRAVVVAKWLEQRSCNLEVPSLNPPGARAFSRLFNQIVLNQVPQDRSSFAVFHISHYNLSVAAWGKAGLNRGRMRIIKKSRIRGSAETASRASDLWAQKLHWKQTRNQDFSLFFNAHAWFVLRPLKAKETKFSDLDLKKTNFKDIFTV